MYYNHDGGSSPPESLISRRRFGEPRLYDNDSDNDSGALSPEPEPDDFLQVHPFVGRPPKSGLYSSIRAMFETGSESDIVVEFPTGYLKCHKMVLECFCNKFRNIHNGGIISLPVDKVPVEIFQWVYAWMVKDGVEIPLDLVVDIYRAASYMEMPMLISDCWCVLDDDIHVQEDVAYAVFLNAQRLGESQMKEVMLSRIRKFFLTMAAAIEFDRMSVEDLKIILRSNSIAVNCESEVFMAAIRWLNADWRNREKYAIEVMSLVRFGLMPQWILTKLHRNNPTAAIRRVVSIPDVVMMIQDGIQYTVALTHMSRHCRLFRIFMANNKLTEPQQRKWVYDRCCMYHYVDRKSKIDCITYDEFLKYQEFLRKQDPQHWRVFEYITGYDDYRWVMIVSKGKSTGRGTPPA